MPVLEARFHPWRKAHGPFLVVARVVCDRWRTVVQPIPAGREQDAAVADGTMIEKLRYLVRRSSPDAFHRLRELRSEFWSFIEIEEGEKG